MAEEIKFRLTGDDALSPLIDKTLAKAEQANASGGRSSSSEAASARAQADRERAIIREVETFRRTEREKSRRAAEAAERNYAKGEAARRIAAEASFRPIPFADQPDRIIPFAPVKREVNRTAFEQRVRDIMADDIKSFRAQTARAADRAAEEEARKTARTNLFGPEKGPLRTVNRSAGEQSGRDIAAEYLRNDRAKARQAIAEAEAARIYQERTGQTPEQAGHVEGGRSRVSRGLELLQGGGQAALASLIGSQLAGAAAELKSAADQLRSGAVKWGEVTERSARALPILGGYISAGRDIKSGLGIGNPVLERLAGRLSSQVGDPGTQEITTGFRGTANKVLKYTLSPFRFTDASQREADRQEDVDKAERRRVISADAREREKYAIFDRQGVATSRTETAERVSIQRDYSGQKLAYMSTEERERADQAILLRQGSAIRTAALSQAATERDRALQAAKDYEKENLVPGLSGTDLKAVEKRVAGLKSDAANQYNAAAEKAELDFLTLQNQTTEKAATNEKLRGQLLNDAWKEYATKRFETSTYLYSQELRRAGKNDEAQIAETKSRFDLEAQERQRAFDAEVKDLDRQGAIYRQKATALAGDLKDIEARKASDIATIKRQQDITERERQLGVGATLRGQQATTEETLLRARGQNQQADRLKILTDAQERARQIREEQRRQDERNGSAEDKARHAKEAEEALNATKAGSLASLLAVNSQNAGADLARGSAASSGLLGGRLTTAESLVQRQKELDPQVLKDIAALQGKATEAQESAARDLKTMADWIRNLK